jgi:phage portal protein BeeE
MLTERIKASKKKVTASQRLHIEMEAAEAYKERHGKPPAKEQVKDKYHDVYPAADLDLLDAAIERVLKRYAKSS